MEIEINDELIDAIIRDLDQHWVGGDSNPWVTPMISEKALGDISVHKPPVKYWLENLDAPLLPHGGLSEDVLRTVALQLRIRARAAAGLPALSAEAQREWEFREPVYDFPDKPSAPPGATITKYVSATEDQLLAAMKYLQDHHPDVITYWLASADHWDTEPDDRRGPSTSYVYNRFRQALHHVVPLWEGEQLDPLAADELGQKILRQ